jgi:hypothetical protein
VVKLDTCPGSGEPPPGDCIWVKQPCLICGREFFPQWSTGKWFMPKHEREEKSDG